MLKLCTLSSGSSGNAVFAEAGGTKLLIDCGISGKAAAERLCSIGVDPSELSAIIVTHEHIDHIKGVGVFSRRYGLPVYASVGTWNGMISTVGSLPADNIRYIEADTPFSVEEAIIFPFATSHDANESLGFTVSDGRKFLSLATDLGKVDKYVYDNIRASELLLLEANHDENMLLNGPYPPQLKQRIFSDSGHISNKVCGALCGRLLDEGGREKRVILGHLSQENNTPRIAFDTVRRSVEHAGGRVGGDIFVTVAGRGEPGEILEA